MGLRVLVVGQRPPIARTLCENLEDAGMQVCGRATSAATALMTALSERPDVCLVDAGMADAALRTVKTIAHRATDAPVVMLGENPSDQQLLEAVAAGASGYVAETLPPARLGPVLRDVCSGRSAFPRRLDALLVAAMRESRP